MERLHNIPITKKCRNLGFESNSGGYLNVISSNQTNTFIQVKTAYLLLTGMNFDRCRILPGAGSTFKSNLVNFEFWLDLPGYLTENRKGELM